MKFCFSDSWKVMWKLDDKPSENESYLDSTRFVTISLIRSIDFDVSGVCNLTFSTQIPPILSERETIIDQNTGKMVRKKHMALIKCILSNWMFILHKAHTKNIRKISLS